MSTSPTSADAIRAELEHLVLTYVDDHGAIADSAQFLQTARKPAEWHERLVPVLQSLQSLDYVRLDAIDHSDWALTSEGATYATSGSPEYQLFQALAQPATAAQLQETLGKELLGIASGQAMKQKWIAFDKASAQYKRVAESVAESVADEVGESLRAVRDGRSASVDAKVLDALKKRKMIAMCTSKTYGVRKGVKFARERKQQATDLTVEMLKSGKWQDQEFKEYNFDAWGADLESGCLHPLMKVRAQFRSILLEMGFSEMPTNNFVESSFWNFDALFQPQQHPARDSHDTFFLTSPAKTLYLPDEAYVKRVQQMHEVGGSGSIGYRYDWKREEAEKTILRTHTTAVSSRMLYLLAQEKEFTPKKYFSIDRVFRNETLDATHLAEFHQVEGLIADYDLSLGDLLGVIKLFFQRIGISDVKFKPAYNPYTEPSMEIFGYSDQLGKWIEVGNSGVFRPEMLTPMGLPPTVKVIAWGLSLERPTMIKYGVRNIRDLFGPRVKLNLIQRNPIARFDD